MALTYAIPDASALFQRTRGQNNLQGHAHSIVPLAVLLARVYPQLLLAIRINTDLQHGMTGQSAEARLKAVWLPVQTGIQLLIASRGGDIVSETFGRATPQTVSRVADTYLSVRYGGGQQRGGAGDTVVKRTLKLLAHLKYE